MVPVIIAKMNARSGGVSNHALQKVLPLNSYNDALTGAGPADYCNKGPDHTTCHQ